MYNIFIHTLARVSGEREVYREKGTDVQITVNNSSLKYDTPYNCIYLR